MLILNCKARTHILLRSGMRLFEWQISQSMNIQNARWYLNYANCPTAREHEHELQLTQMWNIQQLQRFIIRIPQTLLVDTHLRIIVIPSDAVIAWRFPSHEPVKVKLSQSSNKYNAMRRPHLGLIYQETSSIDSLLIYHLQIPMSKIVMCLFVQLHWYKKHKTNNRYKIKMNLILYLFVDRVILALFYLLIFCKKCKR